ncbi:hypothetical protein BZA77DRAFT_345765 [Pyronema omphalodes]|nr:hypothetical protein BZA77DRAFT_346115 [Pyronema omphalodes]KAI5814353.1 hypothetical protein BZA77DRAFT_345765 [Pyronema omphalodes]
MAPLSLINGQNTPAPDSIPSFETLLDQIPPLMPPPTRSSGENSNSYSVPSSSVTTHSTTLQTRKILPESKTESSDPKNQGNQTTDHEAHNDLPYRFMIAGFARLGNLVRSAYVGDTHSAAMHQIDKNTCRQYMSWMGFNPAEVEECWRVVEEKGQEMNGGCGGDGGVL